MNNSIKNYTIHFTLLFVLCNNLFHAQTDSINLSKLDRAIEKGQTFLMRLQRQSGAICDTINPLFDVWETIIASGAIQHANTKTKDSVLLKALSYLKNNQNTKGWICHNQKCKHGYCIESTVAYLRLLNRLGEPIHEQVKTLLKLQQNNGAWLIGNPDVKENTSFPSVTGFMLLLLQEQKLQHLPEYKKAFEFLISKQQPNGHWGYTWEYYNCPAYALWPILQAVCSHPIDTIQKMKALNYCYMAQQANGSWWFQDSLFPKQTSAGLQTAVLLLGLQNDYSNTSELAIKKGISFLLQTQQANGGWDGGFFPIKSLRYVKKEYIFTTAQAVEALVNYKKRLKTK